MVGWFGLIFGLITVLFSEVETTNLFSGGGEFSADKYDSDQSKATLCGAHQRLPSTFTVVCAQTGKQSVH